MIQKLISIPRAAQTIGCSTPTLRRMIREGQIPAVRVGTRLRVNTATLKGFVGGKQQMCPKVIMRSKDLN